MKIPDFRLAGSFLYLNFSIVNLEKYDVCQNTSAIILLPDHMHLFKGAGHVKA
jgi:hypothetical protein